MTPLTDHDIKLRKLAYLRMKQRRNTALCLQGAQHCPLPLVSATSAMCIFPHDYCVPGKYCIHVSQLSHTRVSGAEKSRLYRVQWRRWELHLLDTALPLTLQQGHLDPVKSFELHPSTDKMWIKTHIWISVQYSHRHTQLLYGEQRAIFLPGSHIGSTVKQHGWLA